MIRGNIPKDHTAGYTYSYVVSKTHIIISVSHILLCHYHIR